MQARPACFGGGKVYPNTSKKTGSYLGSGGGLRVAVLALRHVKSEIALQRLLKDLERD